MQKMMGLVRRCIEDYNMISPRDTVAVGVSGGKDSLVLLQLLAGLRQYSDFSLEAVTIDMGLGMDYSPVATFCERLQVPYTVVKTEIGPISLSTARKRTPAPCAPKCAGAR